MVPTLCLALFGAPPVPSSVPSEDPSWLDPAQIEWITSDIADEILSLFEQFGVHGVQLSESTTLARDALLEAFLAARAGEPADSLAPAAATALLAGLEALGVVRPVAPESRSAMLRRVLGETSDGPVLAATVWGRVPWGPDYVALLAALARYRALDAQGGFVALPGTVRKARPQKEHPSVALLRARLHQEDPLVGGDPDPLFGDDVVDALRRARERYLLEPRDAVRALLDKPLLDALAVPAGERVRAISIALDAMRRSQRHQDTYHVWVNLPEFVGRVVDGEREAHRFKVVVGTPSGAGMANATPTLSSTIRAVIFNPDWTVPKRIFRKEMISEFADEIPPETDEGAFEAFWADKGYEVHGRTEKSRYLRLPPGKGNPLGKVKLLFENRHSVYLHDTKSKKLFDKTRRAYSHGCIRVQGPVELAEFLLRKDGTWPLAAEARVLEHWNTFPVELARPVPLHLEYVLVVPDERGGVRFLWDMYGRHRLPRPAKAKR